MLLKRRKKAPGINIFVRKYFDKGEDICSKCYLDMSDNECNLRVCKKANFNGILYSSNYRYAYVIEKV